MERKAEKKEKLKFEFWILNFEFYLADLTQPLTRNFRPKFWVFKIFEIDVKFSTFGTDVKFSAFGIGVKFSAFEIDVEFSAFEIDVEFSVFEIDVDFSTFEIDVSSLGIEGWEERPLMKGRKSPKTFLLLKNIFIKFEIFISFEEMFKSFDLSFLLTSLRKTLRSEGRTVHRVLHFKK